MNVVNARYGSFRLRTEVVVGMEIARGLSEIMPPVEGPLPARLQVLLDKLDGAASKPPVSAD